jgi:LPXTG-motif cell wall-anchored protein
MKKQFIITAVLAFGIGMARAQTQSPPAPMQGGSGDQRGTIQQQAPQNAAGQAMGTPTSTEAAAPQTFKGCLNGSPGSWNLMADNGKNLVLSGTDDQLSPYKGQEVRIQGTQATDGTVKIDSIDQISASCANQTSSNMGAQSQSSTTTSSTTQSTTTTQPPSSTDATNPAQPPSGTETSNSSNTQAPTTATTPETSGAVSGQTSSATSTTAPGAVTPPVTNQTPPNTVGTGQAGQSTAQNPAGSIAGNAQQNAAPSTTNQNPEQTAAPSTSNQNNAAKTDDQGVRHYSDIDENAKLPQTASPVPLLGLLGLGSLAAGLIGRRKK